MNTSGASLRATGTSGLTKLICPTLILLSACSPSTRAQRVTLPPGASFSAVTDSLVAHSVITSPRWFELLARLRGVDRTVHAGVYQFPAGTTPWKALGMLAAGRSAAARFTSPEGLTIQEVADLAKDRLGLPNDSFLVAARDGDMATRMLGNRVSSFEGFLRPETYVVPVTISARELVRIMAEGFRSAWKPSWDARLDSLKMDRVALVTLASIVEGEARADEERETIAGVYTNRLRIGMALQADPTIQYAISLKTGKRKPRLFVKDYMIKSPYNTYLNPGLPPGPVNSPGRRSIEAALYPANVKYLYFVAGPNGRHIFSRTYNEHLRAVRRVRESAKRKP